MNDIILRKLIKYIRERSLEYQKLENKEEINYTHYRKLLNGLMLIIKDVNDK